MTAYSMQITSRALALVLVVGFTGAAGAASHEGHAKALYLVQGSSGPGFATPEETVRVLESTVLPMFDALAKLEAEGKIVAGGLPLGDRAFTFIARAGSHEELDRMLRALPAWGILDWKVTPLEPFADRAAQERAVVKQLKGGR